MVAGVIFDDETGLDRLCVLLLGRIVEKEVVINVVEELKFGGNREGLDS